MKKKLLIHLSLIIACLLSSIVITASSTYAEREFEGDSNREFEDSTETTSGSSAPVAGEIIFEGHTDCTPVLGMTPWDCGVVITDDQETLKSGVWAIATNVAADIAVIASYLALGYVMYGGYQYVLSGDEPSKAAAGKKTLKHAFIGLAITMSSAAIMGTIRAILLNGGNSGTLVDCINNSCIDPTTLFLNTLHWFIAMAGIVSAIFIVYGGISYSTSAGSTEKIRKSKTIIINALIGLAIVAIAEIITAFVSTIIRNANEQALQLDTASQICDDGAINTTYQKPISNIQKRIEASSRKVNHA